MDETAGTGTDTATATDGTPTPAPAAPAIDWQAEAEKWKALSRKHEKQAKDNAEAGATATERQAALDKVLAALGVESGSKTPDVQAITTQLEAAKAAERSRAVELAVLRAAGRNGADGDALLDSRAFLSGLADIDPTDTAAVTEAVKAAVAANPRYALTGAATATGQGTAAPAARQASSTGEFNGAPGGQRQWNDADVDRASPAQLEKAIKDGLLTNLLRG